MGYAMIFPGQGAQSVGMLADLAASWPAVRETFEEASDAVGVDLWKLAQEGPEDALNQTQNTQPVMLAAGMAVWRVLNGETTVRPDVMAGHSLGEYTALTAAGALTLADAARLVALRGRLMQEAAPEGAGAMAAILGLEDERVADVCARAAKAGGVCEPVNFNAPGQVVIAGEREAVERAMALAETAGAKRVVPLAVSVPSHCSLMKPAAERLRQALEETPFSLPAKTPVLHNVDVAVHPEREEMIAALTAQLHRPVQWVETVRAMKAQGVSHLFELGPGKVLTGLNRRIERRMPVTAVMDPASVEAAVKKLEELEC